MKKQKTGILVLIILLAVGFAAVSTTLIINGTAIFGTNEDDFDVIFTQAIIDDTDVSNTAISEDGKTLTFETSNLAIKDDESVLDFTVKNNSTQYDANVTMECVAEGENASEYYEITNTIPNVIEAKTSKEGTVTARLKKSSVEEIHETFTCKITATAVERTETARGRSEIGVTAIDENSLDLNAKAYEITGEDETQLLNSLVETGYISDASEVTALIEVESDEFDNIANTTFDVSSIASEGDNIVIYHFNEETQEWEYISTEVVNEDGLISAGFSSFSPVAFVKVVPEKELVVSSFWNLLSVGSGGFVGTYLGDELISNDQVTYSCDNKNVTVDSRGYVKLNSYVEPGTKISVSAEYDGKTATKQFEVVDVKVYKNGEELETTIEYNTTRVAIETYIYEPIELEIKLVGSQIYDAVLYTRMSYDMDLYSVMLDNNFYTLYPNVNDSQYFQNGTYTLDFACETLGFYNGGELNLDITFSEW